MVGAKDVIERSLDGPLLTSLLDACLASGDIAGADATGLELVSTVSERRSLDAGEVFPALGSLVGNVVAGMGQDDAAQEGEASCGSLGEIHFEKNGLVGWM